MSARVIVFSSGPVPVVAVSPAVVIGAGVLLQSPPITRLAVDTTLTGGSFTTLLTDVVTVTDARATRIRARVELSARALSGSQNVHARAAVDATPGANASCLRAGTSAQALSVTSEFPIGGAGTFTVTMETKVSTAGSGQCFPVSRSDEDSAVLIIEVLS